LGLFLAVMGLTGSVLVFWHELDETINPALYEAAPRPDALAKPIDELLAQLRKSRRRAGIQRGWIRLKTLTTCCLAFIIPMPALTGTRPIIDDCH
jgi:hypothetical protein